MSTATKPKQNEQSADPPEVELPGPSIFTTRYELIRPRAVHPGVISLGRTFDCANGLIGKVTRLTRLSGDVVRVTVGEGDHAGWVDLFGEWMGTVSPDGQRFHKPVVVSPDVAAARKAIGKLSPADRAAAVEGFTPRPAA